MPSQPSPDIRNYYIGTGIVYFQRLGAQSYTDLGNAPVFEFDPKNTRVQHYSSRLSHKFKDDERIISAEPEVSFTLDEYNQFNLSLALSGTLVGNQVNLMDDLDVRGSIKFVGGNRVGPQKTIILPSVLLTPTSKYGFIDASRYAEMMFVGVVLGDPVTGSFGSIVDSN